MVETLIYDSPVAEEERIPEEDNLITDPVAQKLGSETGEPHKPASRVRVTFFECEKPLAVTSPEPPDLQSLSLPFYDLAMSSAATDAVPAFDRQMSTESGRDNPFRPDGDISKEADEIVQLIKSGRPLEVSAQRHITSDAPDGAHSPSSLHRGETNEPLIETPKDNNAHASNLHQQPPTHHQSSPPQQKTSGVNGSAAAPTETSPGPVEVKHATVTPSEPAQVEHVVLKKKNKCSCCVIQ